MANEAPAEIATGQLIGRYRVQHRLGSGAMGELYLAIDEGLNRKVAIKLLAEKHREAKDLRARFLREAKACAAVSHVNVVQVFLIDEYDGRPYFSMEYLQGIDLGRLVKHLGPLTTGDAAAVGAQAAVGLREAASKGVIHRDVKPANLFVTDGGVVKVTDFGLAKTELVEPRLTATGMVVGTPDYIAPEQARGEPIDWRADVYALGCTLFHLVSGQPPFRREGDTRKPYMAVVERHLVEPAPHLAQLVPTIDPDLAGLCARMMAKRPAERPDYDEIIRRLGEIAARLGGRVPAADAATLGPLMAPPPPFARGDGPPPKPTMPRPLVPGWLVALTAAAFAVFLVGVGLRVLAWPKPAAPAVPPKAHFDAGSTAAPTVPDGFIFLPADAAHGALYLARLPVTNRAFADFDHGHAARFKPERLDEPATQVSYAQAQEYARSAGKRLLRESEWHALGDAGLTPPDPALWEWVAGPDQAAVRQPVKRGSSVKSLLAAKGYVNVTFRLAQDVN
jgi:tRNA A-37 threonylcarbamoyl transferase component Bud32